jgi:hypothetical protein
MAREELNNARQVLEEADNHGKREAPPGKRGHAVSKASRKFWGGDGTRTVVSRIARKTGQRGHSGLRGQTFPNLDELAGLLQVYRDPRLETFRVIYVKDGRIMAHEGVGPACRVFHSRAAQP